MKPQEIKDGMSKTPWTQNREFVQVDEEVFNAGTGKRALAICAAVNNTYHIGIDPTQVKAMYDLLGEISAWTSMNVAPDAKQIRDMKTDIDKLLTAAKL